MKFIKMLGLAVVAAIAAMAFVGAAGASAETALLCSTNTEPCTGTKAKNGTAISASLTTGSIAELETNLGIVKCTESSTSGKVTNENEGKAEISKVSFSKCVLGSTECVVTMENIPYEGLLALAAGSAWHFTVHKFGAGGNPQALVKCGSIINCKFGTPNALFVWLQPNPPAEPHAVLHIAQELERIGGFFCPSTSTWRALYLVTSPLGYYAVH